MSSLFPDQAVPLALLRSMLSRVPMFADQTFDDPELLHALATSEADISRRLKCFFEPTEVYAYQLGPGEEPTSGAWYEEPAYDYDPEMFTGDRWGYFALRQTPVIAVSSIEFVYPSAHMTAWTVPADWIRVDKKVGHVQLVPSSQTMSMPLGALVMQAMGSGRVIPHMMRIRYTAGLKDALTKYPDLSNIVLKNAMLQMLDGMFLPQTGSVSADGFSQSSSYDTSKYADEIDRKLFGAGGLFTAIHGVQMAFLG